MQQHETKRLSRYITLCYRLYIQQFMFVVNPVIKFNFLALWFTVSFTMPTNFLKLI